MGVDYDGDGRALVRRAIEGLARGDNVNLCGRVLLPDLRWHEPGRNLVAGDYRGCDEVIGHLFARLNELSSGTLEMELQAIAAVERQFIGIYVTRARRAGLILESRDVCIVDIADGAIAAGRVYHADQHAWDRFWS